ncbi:hypothetical protein BKP37_16730 [Anaerobacillus alkalilacustris]|uniref:Putative Flp pilus-assembly TadG-like N-terminal domain-containing protein n=1 Tax=Anaerobacillus alkalilacustris TaxID=393763 RepID=A0A1S2LHT7_9BACI|nr:Tad domain-containing protein [Anaerobacillus alkalilacustris]OIJ11055.1 hypothetical protein BKP37_16730 [Anaerobacillus alkalilacustris]
MKTFLKEESGSVIILVVLCMTVFIGSIAFVIDMGSLYLEKNRLQKIVDAAALAGAQELPSSETKARQEVYKTIELNDDDLKQFTTSINSDSTLIEVSGEKQGTLFFAKVLGLREPTIKASAVVQLQPLTTGKGSIPLGVQPSMNLSFGSLQTLKVSDSAYGHFGAIALTGPGAKDYETDLKNGYEFDLTVGITLNTQTGQLAGPTRRAVLDRISRCPNATYLNYPPNCSRVVLIPIYEPVQTDQKQIKQVKVVGFGSFFLEDVATTSEGAEVTGRFIQFSQLGTSSPNQVNYGTFGFKLVQ